MIQLHRETGATVGAKDLGAKIFRTRVSAWELIQTLVRKGHVEQVRFGATFKYVPITGTNEEEILTAAIRVLRRLGKPQLAKQLNEVVITGAST